VIVIVPLAVTPVASKIVLPLKIKTPLTFTGAAPFKMEKFKVKLTSDAAPAMLKLAVLLLTV
jgi:hypothetical protein